MRKTTVLLCGAASLALCGAGTPPALQVDCYSVSGDVVACHGGFSDGTAAAGAGFTLYDQKHNELGHGRTDENGVYLFKAPPEDYVVVITAGGTQVASLASGDIGAEPHRPGWGGDWVPAAAVDRLQQLQGWQAQFTGERAPLVKRVEDELAK